MMQQSIELKNRNDPATEEDLQYLDKLTMKRKLKKLDDIIATQGEIKTSLNPDGKPHVEDHREDDDLAKEKEFIMRVLKK